MSAGHIMCQAHYGDIKDHKHNMNLIWGIKSYNFYLILKLGFQVTSTQFNCSYFFGVNFQVQS